MSHQLAPQGCTSLLCKPFKGSNTPASVRLTLQQYHKTSVSFRRSHLAQTCSSSSSSSRQRSSNSWHISDHTAAGGVGFVGARPTTLNMRLRALAAASDSGSAEGTTSIAYSAAGSTPSNAAGSTAEKSADTALRSTPSSLAGSTPGSTAPGSTAGSTAGNTPGNTAGSISSNTLGRAAGSTSGNTLGGAAGDTPGSTAGSTLGHTTGSTPGSTAGTPISSGPSRGTKRPGAGLAGMLQQWQQDSTQLRQQLQSLGLAGVVAYGLFNTAYYTVAFLVVWFTVAKVPAGLGLQAAARKAAEVFALVWAGSQVTKLLRAGGALAFAPVVDQGLNWAVHKFRLKSKQQALWLVVAACSLLAATVFGFVVAVHA